MLVFSQSTEVNGSVYQAFNFGSNQGKTSNWGGGSSTGGVFGGSSTGGVFGGSPSSGAFSGSPSSGAFGGSYSSISNKQP